MTKLIRKTQQPAEYPENNIYDAYNTSTSDTYSCNYVNGAVKETYSTTEQVIGTWIDGKPIYRKVCSGTISSTGGYPHISTGITNLNKMIKMQECILYGNGQYYATNRVSYYLQKSNNDIVMIEPNVTGNITFILEYTKTTD